MNIVDIRKLSETGDVMNQFEQLYKAQAELSQAYERLQDYSQQMEEAAKIKETNRIAREIHDMLGHKMTRYWCKWNLRKTGR